MALKPEVSIPTGLAVAAVVFAIHQNSTPSLADIQALPAGTVDVDAAEKRATWLSVGTVSGISLLAKDPTIFVIGAVATIAMSLMTKQASWTETMTGMIAGPNEQDQAGSSNTPPPAADENPPVTMFAAASSDFAR